MLLHEAELTHGQTQDLHHEAEQSLVRTQDQQHEQLERSRALPIQDRIRTQEIQIQPPDLIKTIPRLDQHGLQIVLHALTQLQDHLDLRHVRAHPREQELDQLQLQGVAVEVLQEEIIRNRIK